jgi:DNA-binding XRE family transcriptional regulator
VTPAKYQRVVAHVRDLVATGILRPGQPAPSGAALARTTGYSVLTCRKAVARLVKDGVLIPGASPSARPRVPLRAPTAGDRALARASRALSESLAARRRTAGLTQPQFAEIVGMSITTVGHAETGRLWQSRRFWELADKELRADGELLALHDAYRAASVSPGTAAVIEVWEPEAGGTVEGSEAVTTDAVPVASVTINWADGTSATFDPS